VAEHVHENGKNIYLAASILISALVLSGTLFVVGSDLSKQISNIKLNVTNTGSTDNTAGNTTGNNAPQGSGNTTAPEINMTELADDDPVEGDPNAPVTIIEFSDFECPFCGNFYKNSLSLIRKDYIETGKVKIIYRDYPLSFHPEAQKAAEASECADEQGKFWEYHDKLFENQADLSVANEKKWAKELGLDSAKFDQCLDSGAMASEVAADFSDGQSIGITGTPSFLINGKAVVGAQPFSVFKQVIDAELAN